MSLTTPKVDTLVQLLQWRAQQQPDRVAYTFLVDGEKDEASLTYQELDCRAKMIAARLQQAGLAGKQALLLYPPGLEYITAFFGCLYAGTVAVPVSPPRRPRHYPKTGTVALDSRASVALTTTEISAHQKGLSSEFPGLQAMIWLDTDFVDDTPSQASALASSWKEPAITSESLAFLQYTSGSTGSPKGVMVSHSNLLHNQAMIHASFAQNSDSLTVGWLPFYHDMGLIGNLLHPLYIGMPYVFMAPTAFIQKPVRWMQAISDYRATTSGGPNFGYELCIERIEPEKQPNLDLSCWEVAFNGAEPIRATTLARFAEKFAPCGFRYEAFHSCYGLAESTLLVSADFKLEQPDILTVQAETLEEKGVVSTQKSGQDSKPLVGCGHAWLDQKIIIADPKAMTPCPQGAVGEVWLSSPSVTQGYWNRPAETRETFQAYLKDTGEGPFLRTGDLGFLQNEQLYITGRVKDLIIIRGRNHYPQDIEQTVERCHDALQTGGGGVFSTEVDGVEQLAVAQEVKRTFWRQLKTDKTQTDEVIQAIRRAISKHHSLSVFAVLLLKPMALPKTSSGKVQRHACLTGYLKQSLDVVAVWQQSSASQLLGQSHSNQNLVIGDI